MLPISLCKTRCSPRLSHLMVSPDQFVSTTVPRSAWSSCQQTLSPTFSCLDCWPVICSPVKLCPEWNFQIAGLSSVFRADQNMDGVRIGAYKPSAGLQPDPIPSSVRDTTNSIAAETSSGFWAVLTFTKTPNALACPHQCIPCDRISGSSLYMERLSILRRLGFAQSQ
jgi:hypothetical protein